MTYTTPPGYTWQIADELLTATHLLIAGTTGSGKSVLLNDIMLSLLTVRTPASASCVLVDPKRVELSPYRRLPFCRDYVQESGETVRALTATSAEMENRYRQMNADGVRTWTGAKIYIIIDELADLMISANRPQILRLLQRILQLGRAAGIVVIAATQAPNRKIIPAELVLNFTDRVALRCVSPIESRQIVQVSGAEKLPKHGEGIYLSPDGLRRVKIPITPDSELQNRINYWQNSM